MKNRSPITSPIHLQMTLFHNMIESSKDSQYWADNALIQAVIGNWFAASHQPWIVRYPCHLNRVFSFAISGEKNLHSVFLELCARPEYIRQLRDEIVSEGSLDYSKISKLPILDSFIKETIRVNPLDKSELF